MGVAPKMGVGTVIGTVKNRKRARTHARLLSPPQRVEPKPCLFPRSLFLLPLLRNRKRKKKSEIDRPENVSELAWADWKIARESRRAGPITQTAWNFLVKEAEKAGITPAQAVELCAGRSWISFQAKYLREEDKPQKSQFEVSADRLADMDNRFSVKAVR